MKRIGASRKLYGSRRCDAKLAAMSTPAKRSLRAVQPPGEDAGQEARIAEVQRRYHAGEVEAFRELATAHSSEVYTHCLRMLGSAESAADAAQDVLLRCLERHRSYDPARAFRPWVLRIATNLCRDRLRTVWWQRVTGLDHRLRAKEASPEALTRDAERDRRVRQALGELPTKYREALSLYHLQDLSYAEMAEITGVGVSALKQRVRRGRIRLGEILSRMYPPEAL